ncbi:MULTISPECIES: bifunctional adenosylcobinamide kinase/adenosylcobinamide-phosphate guanylyltransferase [Halomonadaceae]|jgi:adenosylcobinamide kinase/adenosylcobinamide-phosphate guanylyltransferase|uniref:Bifunctional adenosylcobalamin biosynthesis protein n=1 Tax=Vreelandella piezotolerans TaxID=2609667 RepID=A0ABQ6X4K5_9GAMM|nr:MULTISPECIES: bifunctional adenosylcobinamide kinase/adenosylcobinamide-phosphate guanylyltransferase [Halomonas]KAE8436963.1 bifunctional adenosylcobinamide kinase/adenosylcobinamide-phosphate guanylyltransferase [Halomonas piezotolerans]MCG7577473.1 bifunctional adenosylcobinamide kinase/adenosylcobinamide-phosphate guanylyltransferase [Halomonas sp. MMH1-48]MCG7604444.1 bifunctional adenosylcobinamide kinase/adenosylcobinamide-phosphate guanylyltransferase [Halomonas sp. MM17-34]MCG761480
MIVFVSGGARSGKSHVAEQYVLQAANGQPCFYVATANVYDDEMAERVALHRADRDAQGVPDSWVTLEAPLAIDQAIARVPNGHAALLDCLTLWASQVMFDADDAHAPLSTTEGFSLLVRCLQDARARHITLVVVSNDLNEAPLPNDTHTQRYVEFLQMLHRWLAVESDSVIEVVAGQGIEWKAGANT